MFDKKKTQLIVALDVDSLAEMRELLDKLAGVVSIFKIGSQLFTSCGPAAVRFIQARGLKVFLDLKFHDIPNTVANAVHSAVGLSVALDRTTNYLEEKKAQSPGLYMLTVHTLGGLEMMRFAVEAGKKTANEIGSPPPLVVGVTVLTSEKQDSSTSARVLERALLAQRAGCSGIVASCQEAQMLRKEFGKDFMIVTPGIRPAGVDSGDQKRVATPAEAVKSGSDFIVVGRPIVKAQDPRKSAEEILKQLAG